MRVVASRTQREPKSSRKSASDDQASDRRSGEARKYEVLSAVSRTFVAAEDRGRQPLCFAAARDRCESTPVDSSMTKFAGLQGRSGRDA